MKKLWNKLKHSSFADGYKDYFVNVGAASVATVVVGTAAIAVGVAAATTAIAAVATTVAAVAAAGSAIIVAAVAIAASVHESKTYRSGLLAAGLTLTAPVAGLSYGAYQYTRNLQSQTPDSSTKLKDSFQKPSADCRQENLRLIGNPSEGYKITLPEGCKLTP